MAYDFQDRLGHNSTRFKQINKVCSATYYAVREGTTYQLPLSVSPILISSMEMGPGDASLLRVEYQDMALDVCDIKPVYPPHSGDEVRYSDGQRFQLAPVSHDEPVYQHITSRRERVLVHTRRVTR